MLKWRKKGERPSSGARGNRLSVGNDDDDDDDLVTMPLCHTINLASKDMIKLSASADSLDARLQPGVTGYHDNRTNAPPAMSTFKAPFGSAPPPVAPKPPRRSERTETRSILHKHSVSSETESQTSSEKSVTFALAGQSRTIDDVSKAVDHALRVMTPEPYSTSEHSMTSRSLTPSSDRTRTSRDKIPPTTPSPNLIVTMATVHSTSHSPISGYHDDGDDEYEYHSDDYYTSSPVGRDGYYPTSPAGRDGYYPSSLAGRDRYYPSSPDHHEPTSDYSSGNLSNTSQRDIIDTQTSMSYKKQRKSRKLSYLDILPDNCIIKIFSYLDTIELFKCSRINRRWYGLVWDASLWSTISISDSDYDVDSGLKVLTTRLSYETPTVCMSVQNVVLNGCSRLTDRGLRYLAQRCPELLKLEIQGCTAVSNWALFEIVSNCTNLQHLDTTGCTAVTCISLTPEASLRSRPLRNKQILLRHLDMTDCTNLEDSGLSIIASHCTQLVNLYLRRCVRISDIGVQYVATYCTSLKELSVCDCRRLTDFSLRELSKLDNSLRYLSVAKCERISDVGVKYLAHYCQKLRYLNVRGCEAVSDESIIPLAKNCKRLRSLDVGKCDVSDDSVITLANHCTQLKKISMKACEGVTDTGVAVLARKCPQLEQLNIQECHLTVEAYRAVKRHCKRCVIEHTNPGFC